MKQKSFNLLSKSDEADEYDLEDKPAQSIEDVTIYTDAFVNDGQNIKSINEQEAQKTKAKLEKVGFSENEFAN